MQSFWAWARTCLSPCYANARCRVTRVGSGSRNAKRVGSRPSDRAAGHCGYALAPPRLRGTPIDMRAVVQRVLQASVTVEGEVVGQIDQGLCALVGVAHQDDERHVEQLVNKVSQLRVFQDAAGKMNHSLGDIGGAQLAVSQFTLLGD